MSIRNIYYYENHCPHFDWTTLQVMRTSFLSPRPNFYPPLALTAQQGVRSNHKHWELQVYMYQVCMVCTVCILT